MSKSGNGGAKRFTGERVADTKTPIRFYKAKKSALMVEDGEETPETVSIQVKIDPAKDEAKSNMTKATFNVLEDFSESGEKLIELRRDLDVKVYKGKGIQTGHQHVPARFQLLSVVCGTNAVQQLTKAIKNAFVTVSSEVDPDLDLVERSNIANDQTRIHAWLEKPRTKGWADLTNAEKSDAVKQAYKAFEDVTWFQLNALAYPNDHSEALNNFDVYVRTQLVKPVKWTITTTMTRLSELFEMRKYIPATGTDPRTANYDGPRTAWPSSGIRQCEYALLPTEWKTRVQGKMDDWATADVTEWMKVLRQVEKESELDETKRNAKGKSKTGKPKRSESDMELTSDDEERVKKARKKSKSLGKKKKDSHKSGKTTSQGKAKFCAFCYKLGRTKFAYTSHNESECTLKSEKDGADPAKGFSGGRREKAKSQHDLEKKFKKQNRQLREMKKVMKMMHYASNKEARLAAAKKDSCSMDNFFESDSSSMEETDSEKE